MPFVIHFVADNPENLNELESALTYMIAEVEDVQVIPVSKLELSKESLLEADTVFVSPFIKAQLVAEPLLASPTPVINASRSMAVHMGYAKKVHSLNKIDVQIENTTHPLSANLSGEVNIYNPDDDFAYLEETPASVTSIVSYQNKPVILHVSPDSVLLDGKKNAAELVGLHIFQGEIPGNVNWGQFIEASVSYALSLSRRLPSPWEFENIGAQGTFEGFARFDELDGFSIHSSGSNINKEKDGFSYLYQPAVGDMQMVINLSTFSGEEDFSKLGIMFRDKLTPDSRNIGLYFIKDRSEQIRITQRSSDGARTQNINSELSSENGRDWLKFVKTGSEFSAFTSDDGENWDNLYGSDTFPFELSENYFLGVALTAANVNAKSSAVLSSIDIQEVELTVDGLPNGFTHTEIGSPGTIDSIVRYRTEGDVFAMSSSRPNINRTADSFTYVHKPLNEPKEAILKVDSLYATGATSAKAGLMFRSGLESGSAHVGLFAMPGADAETRITFRQSDGGSSTNVKNSQFPQLDEAPVWLKLVNTGSNIRGYASADGTDWKEISENGGIPVTLNGDYFGGIALSSGAIDTEITAEFTALSFQEVSEGEDPGDGNPPEDGGNPPPEEDTPRENVKSDKFSYTPIVPSVYTYGMDMNPSGRDGNKVHVIEVTNLSGNVNSKPNGSLPWAINQAKNKPKGDAKYIVFKVSGNIKLNGELVLDGLTKTRISGQTCKRSGVYVHNAQVRLKGCDELMIEHITFGCTDELMGGSNGPAREWDTILVINNNKKLCLKNCTLYFSVDELIGTNNHERLQLSMINCILADALHKSKHPNIDGGDGHSKGALIRDESQKFVHICFLNTAFLNNHDRNPKTSVSFIMANHLGNNPGPKFVDFGSPQYKSGVNGENLKTSILSAYFEDGENLKGSPNSPAVKPLYVQNDLRKGKDKFYINPNIGPNGNIYYVDFPDNNDSIKKMVKFRNRNHNPDDFVQDEPIFYVDGHVDISTLKLLKAKDIPAFIKKNSGAFPWEEHAYQREVKGDIGVGRRTLIDRAPRLSFPEEDGYRKSMPTSSNAHKKAANADYTPFELWLQELDETRVR